jgi:hypothetical protein
VDGECIHTRRGCGSKARQALLLIVAPAWPLVHFLLKVLSPSVGQALLARILRFCFRLLSRKQQAAAAFDWVTFFSTQGKR